MHRCLRIPEILVEICEYLAVIELSSFRRPVVRSRKATAALAAFARTCKTIQNPALDILWADLDYFVRLIQCLPRDLWKVQEVPTTTRYSGPPKQPVIFQRSMTLSDWKVFNKYAHRVRSLAGMTDTRGYVAATNTISSEVLLVFGGPPASPILPNLCNLTWDSLSPDCISLFRHLLSPKIIRLVLNLDFNQLDLYSNSVLSVIGDVCPQMDHFVLCRRQSSRDMQQSINMVSQVVASFQHIRTLEVDAINGKAIAHLARLPSLTSVSFALDPSIEANFIKWLPAKPFPVLATLTIRAPDVRR
ncbi:hypothetical protein BJ138DRAFT_652821, partial [Hygrophoropsis aurantiaca]